MFKQRNQSWLTVETGGRLLRCEMHSVGGRGCACLGSVTVDIEAEGLLSTDEIGAMIERVVGPAARLPAIVILPDSLVTSQLVERTESLEREVMQAFGGPREEGGEVLLAAEDLERAPGFTRPVWVGVASQSAVIRQLAPLLARGIHVEHVTSAANALAAAYAGEQRQRIIHLEEGLTTLVQLENGVPVYTGTLEGGGGQLVEAVADATGLPLERVEEQFATADVDDDHDDVFTAALEKALRAWLGRVASAFDEREAVGPVLWTGEYGSRPRLRGAAAALGLQLLPDSESPATSRIGAGAARLAAGLAKPSINLIPGGLRHRLQVRDRQRRFRGLVVALFAVAGLMLALAINVRWGELAVLEERLAVAERLLEERREAVRIVEAAGAEQRAVAPLVLGQTRSTEVFEIVRTVVGAGRELDFRIERLANAGVFLSRVRSASAGPAGGPARRAENGRTPAREPQWSGYILEISLEGEPAVRLERLGEIVTALEASTLFLNVDRLPGQDWRDRVASVEEGRERYFLRLATDGEKSAFRRSANERRREGP